MLRLTTLLVATLLTASFAGCLASSEEKERDEGTDNAPATDSDAGAAAPSSAPDLAAPDVPPPEPIPAPTSAPAYTEPQVAIPDGDCVLRVGLLGIGVSVC